jgi:hypothetical protein
VIQALPSHQIIEELSTLSQPIADQPCAITPLYFIRESFAFQNPQNILSPVDWHGEPPAFCLRAGNMFESSFILIDRVWDKKELGIESEILAAVPARDTLLVADSANAGAVLTIQKASAQIAGAAAYRLTDQIFVRRDGVFARWGKINGQHLNRDSEVLRCGDWATNRILECWLMTRFRPTSICGAFKSRRQEHEQ